MLVVLLPNFVAPSKFSCDEIIKTIGLIFGPNMFGVTIMLFLLLISKYVQKCK